MSQFLKRSKISDANSLKIQIKWLLLSVRDPDDVIMKLFMIFFQSLNLAKMIILKMKF